MKRVHDDTPLGCVQLPPELWQEILLWYGPFIQCQPICHQWQALGLANTPRWMPPYEAEIGNRMRKWGRNLFKEWCKQPAEWPRCWELWRAHMQLCTLFTAMLTPRDCGTISNNLDDCFMLRWVNHRYVLLRYEQFKHCVSFRVTRGLWDVDSAYLGKCVSGGAFTNLIVSAQYPCIKTSDPVVRGEDSDAPTIDEVRWDVGTQQLSLMQDPLGYDHLLAYLQRWDTLKQAQNQARGVFNAHNDPHDGKPVKIRIYQ